ncbi:MAG: hypothetical protein ACI9MR_000070 [Myxococcota bacterium]|jgi:hypothetical protein
MGSKLLVEGLDWGTTDVRLRDAFATFGDVLSAKVATDWETGRSRGYGHVTFTERFSAEQAIATMDGARLDGKVLRVMLAPDQPRPKVYRGGDYGRVGQDAAPSEYRGGDYSDSSRPKSDDTVYRSANFGYADGATKASTYRSADYDGPRARQTDTQELPALPIEAPTATEGDAAATDAATKGDAAAAGTTKAATKTGSVGKEKAQNAAGISGGDKKTFG